MNTSPSPDDDANGVQLSANGVPTNAGRSDVYLKLLVPNAAVGALLGRGGDYVTKLQQETGTKIKMSRPNEFYPGTTDRVCLISGSFDSVAHSCGLIVRKVCDRPTDSNNQPTIASEMDVGSPTPRRMNGERAKQLKLLVTNSTAGMVIGKGGSNIKEIKEESGALIQISQKASSPNAFSLNNSQSIPHAERLITISGDFEELDRAVRLILRKIESDPQSSACVSISYADANANVNATGAGNQAAFHGAHQAPFSESVLSPRFTSLRSRNDLNGVPNERSNGPQFDNRQMRGASGFSGHASGADQAEAGASGAYAAAQRSSANLEQIAAMLRSSGYTDLAVIDITSAMNTLMAYGLLSINVDTQSAGGSLQYSILGGLQLQASNGAPPGSFQPAAYATQTGFQQPAYPHPGYVHANLPASAAAQTGPNANTAYLPSTNSTQYVNAGAPVQSSDDALSLSSASFSVPVQSGNMVDVDPNGNAPATTYTTMPDGQTIVPINVFEMLNHGGLPQLGTLQPGLGALNPNSLIGQAVSLANMSQVNLNEALGSGVMQQRFADDGVVNGGALVQREVKVHESMIGVIFGVGGKWIAELQSQTGANIQVSKKGVYAPATHDRVVTLKGSQPSVTQAYSMIMQKLNNEEERRTSRRQTRGDRQSADSEYMPTA